MNSSELPFCKGINFNSTIAAGATAVATAAVGIDVVRNASSYFKKNPNVSRTNCLTLWEV